MENNTCLGNRILILGPYGAGKTTLGRKLSQETGIPLYEMDSLFWQKDWKPADREEFLAKVREITRRECWIIEGHFTKIKDLVLPGAESIVFLDLSLPKALTRLFKRTIRRVLTRETLAHGNRESAVRAFLTTESPLWRLLVDYSKRRKEFLTLAMDSTLQDLGKGAILFKTDRHKTDRPGRSWPNT